MLKKSGLDMTEGPILKKLILFTVPLVFNSVIDQLYSTADTMMMGWFAGTEAMAAVGASGHPMNLLVNLFAGLSMGVNVTCGNLRGGKKTKELSECMHSSVLMGLLIGLFISVWGLFLCGPLLRSLDTPVEILDDAVLYMKTRLYFGPVWMLTTFCASILHAHGETRIPTLISIFSGLLNVCLNVVFVPFMSMGVEGVALATGISQTVKAVVLGILLFSPKGAYKLTFSGLRLRWKHVVSILTVGIPNGLSNIVFSISNVLLQSAVNGFGYLAVAGNTAATHVTAYVTLVLNAFRSACVSASAQCCGARKPERLDKLVKTAIPAGLVMVVLLSIPMTLFGKKLMALFTEDPMVPALGYPRLLFTCWGNLLFLLVKVFGGCLAGMRKSSVSLICDLVCIIAPRLLWVWFVVPYMQTPTMLFAIYPITWLFAAIFTGVAFRHYRKKMETEILPTTAEA